jgi:tetratricopeptide (TPR) repeat protein
MCGWIRENRSRGRTRRLRVAVATALAACWALGLGCESSPLQAIRGARLYASGNAALERGDAGRAVMDLERAAELVPNASEVQNHLGLAYWAEGRTEFAYSAFERALELDCDNAPARQNLDRLGAMIRRNDSTKVGLPAEGAEHGG